jgi:hypothetical protein
LKKVILKVFSHWKRGEKKKWKSPDFYIWFSLGSPETYKRMIKDLYFICGFYSQIWVNLHNDDCHFGYNIKKNHQEKKKKHSYYH